MSYVQYVYHFPHRNSIDVRTVCEDDLEWCDGLLTSGRTSETITTLLKMYHQHFPERLI